MAHDEQTIIERYFRHLGAVRTDVVLGIGDDAALLRARAEHELVQTTDSLVEHVHFLPGSPPRSLGHRALAVNLSDLAAMGATPAWALLSLTLPQIDEAWLGEFATGFGVLARTHGVALVGGNLSRGPLAITVQLTGQVPVGTALRRGGGQAGDELWVSGTLGDAMPGSRPPTRGRSDSPRALANVPAASIPRHGSNLARRCEASPAPASTSPTGCLPTRRDLPRPAAAAPGSMSNNCRYRRRCARLVAI